MNVAQQPVASTELRHMADTLDVYAEAADTRAHGGSSNAHARWAGKVDGYKVAARMLREQAGRLDTEALPSATPVHERGRT